MNAKLTPKKNHTLLENVRNLFGKVYKKVLPGHE